MARYRTEADTLGQVRVPSKFYYGAQTQRAVENFPVSGITLPPSFVRAQAVVKRAAALANWDAGMLDRRVARALVRAAEEVIAGRFDDHFVVDVFQAGAGTSQNMNMNEVLANRAEEILGGRKGSYIRVHPNDHANMGQSTNDTIHAAIHIAAVIDASTGFLPALHSLASAFAAKARRFNRVIKCGRTHLQDAVPMRLGQEFGAYATAMERAAAKVEDEMRGLAELPIGGTAVGTGLNAATGFRTRVLKHINEGVALVLTAAAGKCKRRLHFPITFRAAADPYQAMQSLDAVLSFSGSLRLTAASLGKIADDIRLLSSGPRTGLAEIILPPVQPGSSIMPGKVNPVMAEMVNMVCYQVMGCDAAIAQSCQAGELELNVMMPVIAYNLLFALKILARAVEAFDERCVQGIKADRSRCLLYAERSAALATALAPAIGYEQAARLSRQALEQDRTVKELVVDKGILSGAEAEKVLDLDRLAGSPWRRGRGRR